MVELNPRPYKPNLFVQVSVAVISGAAAMYCIQNLRLAPAPRAPEARESAAKAPPPSSEPPPALPDSSIAPARFKAAAPTARSMMVVPEPGGAEEGILSVGADEPAAERRGGDSRTAPKKKKSPEAPVRKEIPAVHLRRASFHSPYAGPAVGRGFESAPLAPHLFPKKEEAAPAEEEQAAPPPVKTPPRLIVAPRILSVKPIPQKDIFVPSLLHPEIVPEKPFWNDERKYKALLSGLVALFGVLYLLSALGFFNAFIAKPRDSDS